MDSKLLQDAVTMFVVINPIGLVPLFIAVTPGQSAAQRRRIAARSVVIAAVILLAFIAIGEFLLDGLKVSLPAFRVAGGLVLLLIALRMVLSEQDSRAGAGETEREDRRGDVAVFPIAMPFIAGPGAVMAAVLLTENKVYSLVDQAETALVVLVVLAITYVVMLGAETVQRLIGATGTNVLSRVLGLVLAAVAAETMLGGLRTFFGLR